MKNFFQPFIVFILSGMLLMITSRFSGTLHAGPLAGAKMVNTLPSGYFLENKGQVRDQYGGLRTDIDFSVPAQNGMHAFVGAEGITYQWSRTDAESEDRISMYRMEVKLLGANTKPQLIRELKTAYYERHFNASAAGIKAESYRKFTYRNVYPHIDWVFYFNEKGQVEHDFVVHPGGRVSDIRMQFGGADKIVQSSDGSLVSSTPMGQVKDAAPYSYDEQDKKIPSAYILKDGVLGFKTGAYNGRLTIDPVLEWGTYFGGELADHHYEVASDGATRVYMTGHTKSTRNIATTGAWQTTINANFDIFLVRFDSTGAKKWATYYGGREIDYAQALTLDSSGNVYLGAYGRSDSLATPGVHQDTIFNKINFEGYLVKFDSTGNRIWHSYYGGSSEDVIHSVAADKDGFVYISGETRSTTGISSPNAYQTQYGGGTIDAFVAKFDSSGKRVWGTYIGGPGNDEGWDVVCDAAGFVYACGKTASQTNIATPNSHLSQNMGWTMNGWFFGYTAFLSKFTSGGAICWSTYYSGGMSMGTSLAADPYYNVYMVGTVTQDTIYTATPGAHQEKHGNMQDNDGFLAKFDSSGVLGWATYYGGVKGEGALKVASNSRYVYITGQTTSEENIATPDGLDTTYGYNCDAVGSLCKDDIFIAKFDTAGVRLWGTYLGTEHFDYQPSINVDDYGSFYLGGTTKSTYGIATAGSQQSTLYSADEYDAFLMKFYDCPATPGADFTIVGNDTVCSGSDQLYIVPDSAGISHIWQLPSGWTGADSGDSVLWTASNNPGSAQITVRRNAYCEKRMLTGPAVSKQVYIPPFTPAEIVPFGDTLTTSASYASWTWLLEGDTIQGAHEQQYVVQENGSYSVVVTDVYGCTDTSDRFRINNVYVPLDKIHRNDIRIYPNPASEVVHIESQSDIEVNLLDNLGRVVYNQAGAGRIRLDHLAEGMYLIVIRDLSGRTLITEKLIVSGR